MRAGPRPFDLPGRRRTWSYARSPCFSNDNLLSLGDSTDVVNPRAVRTCQHWSSLRLGSIEHHPQRKAKLHVQLIRIVTNTPYLDAILSKPET